VLVVEFDDELAGWLVAGHAATPNRMSARRGDRLLCRPAHWRKGLGSALMAAGIERLTRAGYQLAVLWVLTDNSVHGRSTNTKAGSRTGAEDVRDGRRALPRGALPTFAGPKELSRVLMLSGERSDGDPGLPGGRPAPSRAAWPSREIPRHVLATRTRVHRSGETAAVP